MHMWVQGEVMMMRDNALALSNVSGLGHTVQ